MHLSVSLSTKQCHGDEGTKYIGIHISYTHIHGKYEGRLKSSWTGDSAPLLCLPLHNSGVLPLVHEIFKGSS